VSQAFEKAAGHLKERKSGAVLGWATRRSVCIMPLGVFGAGKIGWAIARAKERKGG